MSFFFVCLVGVFSTTIGLRCRIPIEINCSLSKREICFILVLEYVLGYFCMFAEER